MDTKSQAQSVMDTKSQAEHEVEQRTNQRMVLVEALWIDTWTGDLVAQTEDGSNVRIRTPRSKQNEAEFYHQCEIKDYEKRQCKLEDGQVHADEAAP